MLDTALEILQQYISKDAEETLETFREYKNRRILDKLNKMREEEKTEEIRESKKAYVECENILHDPENEIPSLLEEIGNTDVRELDELILNGYDSNSIFEPFEPTFSSSQSRLQKKYLIFFGASTVLAIVVIGMYFIKKQKRIVAK